MKTLREALEQLMQQHRDDGHAITYADLCAVLELPDAAPVVDWPAELTPELRHVLGLMNYSTGPMAHAFRDCGVGHIPKRCEDEQAFILHWLVGVALKHGDKWKDVAAEQFGEMMAKAKCGVPDVAPL